MNEQELNKRICHFIRQIKPIGYSTVLTKDYHLLKENILMMNRRKVDFKFKYLDCLTSLVNAQFGDETSNESDWKVHTASVFKMAIAFAYAVGILESQKELLELQYLADQEDN